jgi:hypothetical protein
MARDKDTELKRKKLRTAFILLIMIMAIFITTLILFEQ